MPTISIQVPDIDATLAAGYTQIRVYRSDTSHLGPYVEITAAGTRIPLVAGTSTYSYTDAQGDDTDYYRISYYNDGTGADSGLSDPVQGAEDPALQVLSVEELKERYLFGLDLTDDAGNPMPDSLFQHYIKSAVASLERKIDVPIRRVRIVDEPYPFILREYYKFIWINLQRFPVINVENVRMELPVNQRVYDFPPEWLYVDRHIGRIEIVPGSGSLAIPAIGETGVWLPMINGWHDYIPDVFHVTYEAGFETVPDDIKDLVGKIASFGPLNIAGDLIVGAGIASKSISMDGLSQSVNTTSSATNSGYGARLVQYEKEIKQAIPVLRQYYHGGRAMVG